MKKQDNGLQVFACNVVAHKNGVKVGMRLTDACSLLPSLQTQPWDHEADARALYKLAEWCQRYTPSVAIDGDDSLWLDVTGATHLWGGEAQMLQDLKRRLKNIGFESRLGLAETPGAAWAMARYAAATTAQEKIVSPGCVKEKLAPLSVSCLRLDENAGYLLKRFGFKAVASLYEIPREALKRRFSCEDISASVLQRLDQALGVASEPLLLLRPVPSYRESLLCPEPLLETEGFRIGLSQLLERLCQSLEKDRKGATSLTYAAYHADGGVSCKSIATAAPSRNISHFMHLFRDRLEEINPGFGVDLLVLSANTVEALTTEQLTLSATEFDAMDASLNGNVNQLIDRLSNRLGARNVQHIMRQESHLPECAEIRVPALKRRMPERQDVPSKPIRPCRIFSTPEFVDVLAEVPEGPPRQFTWRRVVYKVARVEGPERIAPEWWQVPEEVDETSDRTRDYYRVEDVQGRRFWLFREGLYRNFTKDHPPTWRIHGVFS